MCSTRSRSRTIWRRGHAHAPNTLRQLREMAASGVEIGSHSHSHADLGPAADAETLEREIHGSKQRLEETLGRPVRYFAFPFGQYDNLSAAAFARAKEAGYAGVCSAYGGFNFQATTPSTSNASSSTTHSSG